MRKYFLAITLLGSASLSAEANISLQSINTLMSSQEKLIYITGVASGYSWYNTYLEHDGKELLFCVPSELGLNPQNYMNIFEGELKEQNYKPDSYVEIILMQGLKRTFPCK